MSGSSEPRAALRAATATTPLGSRTVRSPPTRVNPPCNIMAHDSTSTQVGR